MTRQEHMDWCKRRALEYLPQYPHEAFASMTSDLGKHPETENHIALKLGMQMLMGGHLNSPHEMRRFIEGFN